MTGYAARLRVVRRLLREGHGPARIGAADQGAVATVFDDGTRVVIAVDTVEIVPPSGGPATGAAFGFATRLAALAGVALSGDDPAREAPGPSPL